MTASNTSKNKGGRFEAWKDDIPLQKLTFEEIEFIMKTISSRDDSPLSLNFRIMPDNTAFKRIKVDAQPFKKDGFLYYRILYSLSCYTSLKYRGSGSVFESDNYTTGGKLWEISAIYGYEIDEKEAIPNSNETFLHKNKYVYYRTEQPNKTYEMKFVDIEDRQGKIPAFLEFYFSLKERLVHTKTWIDQKLDMEIKCECGHDGKIDYHVLVGILTGTSTIDSVTSRLKCNSCGKKGAGKAFPIYSESTPKNFMHNTAWVPFNYRGKIQKHTTIHNPELEDMYKNVGGDGASPVYLTDGTYLSPNGEVSED